MSERLTKLVVSLEARQDQFLNELNKSRTETARWKKQVQGSLNGVAKTSVKSSAVMRGGFRAARGAAGQFGYQIQDIAVQLQSGQNAMLIFGQQGSQIASIFGPGGAVLGAVLAVGAALATAFLPNLFKSKETVDDLAERIRSFNKDLSKLTVSQRAVLINKLTAEFEAQKKVISDTTKELERLSVEQVEHNRLMAMSEEEIAGFGAGIISHLAALRQNSATTTAEMHKLIATIDLAAQEADLASEKIKNFGEAEKKRSEDVANMISALQKEAATYGMTAKQIALYEAALIDANWAERMEIETLHDLAEARAEADRKQESIDEIIDRLTTMVSTYGYSAKQLDIYAASQRGASDAEMERISSLWGLYEAAEAAKKAALEADRQQKVRDSQFRQVDNIMRVGIGGYGTSDDGEKLDSIDRGIGELVEMERNNKGILV